MFWLDSIPQGDIEGIDTQLHTVTREFPGAGMQFENSHDGRWLFIVTTGTSGNNVFDVRSTTTGQIVAQMPLPHGSGVLTKVSPDGKTVYLVGEGTTPLPLTTFTSSNVDVIDVSNPVQPRFVKSIRAGSFPLDAVFTPDGRQMWTANSGDGTISVVDLASNKVVHTISTGRYISGLGFYGDTAYLVQSPYPIPPTYPTSLFLGIADVIPGAATAPESGSTSSRPGIDPPGEIAIYDRTTYQPLNQPTIALPSESFGIETVMVPSS
jgi:YVTN family beta-propeller protein